jgi:hypothetical protein
MGQDARIKETRKEISGKKQSNQCFEFPFPSLPLPRLALQDVTPYNPVIHPQPGIPI